jgi:hypothetical protein
MTTRRETQHCCHSDSSRRASPSRNSDTWSQFGHHVYAALTTRSRERYEITTLSGAGGVRGGGVQPHQHLGGDGAQADKFSNGASWSLSLGAPAVEGFLPVKQPYRQGAAALRGGAAQDKPGRLINCDLVSPRQFRLPVIAPDRPPPGNSGRSCRASQNQGRPLVILSLCGGAESRSASLRVRRFAAAPRARPEAGVAPGPHKTFRRRSCQALFRSGEVGPLVTLDCRDGDTCSHHLKNPSVDGQRANAVPSLSRVQQITGAVRNVGKAGRGTSNVGRVA